MNLQPVNPTPGNGEHVNRYGCGVRFPLIDALTDLDGPAFRAFYCADCVNRLQPEDLDDEKEG